MSIQKGPQLRIWHGITPASWLLLLARYGFRISPSRIYRASFVFIVGLLLLQIPAFIQSLLFSRRIAQQEMPKLVFIVGPWRTGSTYLHRTLAAQPGFFAPTTQECFGPKHVLVSNRIARMTAFLMPKTRPMDDMPVGLDEPQEDEFALMMLGHASPYEAILFPRDIEHAATLFTPEGGGVSSKDWLASLDHFIRLVSFRRARQRRKSGTPPSILVLKSPPHSARIDLLSAHYPDALFIRLQREANELWTSNCKMWAAMVETQGLQKETDGFRQCAETIGRAFLGALEEKQEAFDRLPPERLRTIDNAQLRAGGDEGVVKLASELADQLVGQPPESSKRVT